MSQSATEIRLLLQDEMQEAAAVHRAAYDERLPWLSGRYSPADDASYFAQRVFRDCRVWGAVSAARIIGILAFRDGWINQLYVLPASQGAGVGTALLAVPKAQQRRLRLWTFQRNDRARAFYERRGFVAIDQTDGARNDEREPDVLYEWRAAD
jgi:GNAT superfamily N-acetyltransferase